VCGQGGWGLCVAGKRAQTLKGEIEKETEEP
jgi:hypothetical protein